MTEFDLRAASQRALDLTAEKHRTSYMLELVRSRIADHLKRQYRETGAVAKIRRRNLGEVRLDGADPEPKAVVTNAEEYSSWIAERVPDEAVATIEVPADSLEDALATLALGDVKVHESRVTVRAAFQTAHLKGLEVNEREGWVEGSGEPRWEAIDLETGEVVPGVGGKLPDQVLKIILAKEHRQSIEEDAEAEDAQLLADAAPTDDGTADDGAAEAEAS